MIIDSIHNIRSAFAINKNNIVCKNKMFNCLTNLTTYNYIYSAKSIV